MVHNAHCFQTLQAPLVFPTLVLEVPTSIPTFVLYCIQHSCLPNLANSTHFHNLRPQTHFQMCFEWDYHPYLRACNSFVSNYLKACKSPLSLAFSQLCSLVSHINGIIITVFYNLNLESLKISLPSFHLYFLIEAHTWMQEYINFHLLNWNTYLNTRILNHSCLLFEVNKVNL